MENLTREDLIQLVNYYKNKSNQLEFEILNLQLLAKKNNESEEPAAE